MVRLVIWDTITPIMTSMYCNVSAAAKAVIFQDGQVLVFIFLGAFCEGGFLIRIGLGDGLALNKQ